MPTLARAAHAVTAALALLTIGAADAPREKGEYVVRDPVVRARLNGAEGRVRIDPAATAMPLLNAAFAERAKLRAGPVGAGYRVGPETVTGRTAVARIGIADVPPRKRRVAWAVRDYAAGIDGVVGPGALPQPVIRFALRPSLPGERTVTLPMVEQGGLFGSWGATFGEIMVAGAPLRVRFAPHSPHTLATAAAAARIAEAHGGTVSGMPTTVAIAFGIERPVRTMRLGTPIAVGPLAIAEFGVRTADAGSAASIPEEGAIADPDEILVAAKGKRRPERDILSIGADQLDRCSSIVFDKPAKQIRLSCR